MGWNPHCFRLFISHVSASRKLAAQVAEVLQSRYGIHGFVAHSEIEPTSEWQHEIENSLRSMHALLALLTQGFSASLWCNQEVGWALGQQQLALSIRLGEDPRGFVGKFQALPGGDGNAATIAETVFNALANHPATRDQLGLTLAEWLRHADSWETVKHSVAPALRRVESFTPEALDVLERAFVENSYVSSSFYLDGLRERLKRLGRHVPDQR